ncbi:MAG: MFS transporter [Verrucomicrobiota bacterium]|nr:MFS transporter [Limisphaera sp.]MDW8382320.1 MFS transporter [Verrucomicrobiota bacterium]
MGESGLGDFRLRWAGLFFLHALAMGMWFVPLSLLLRASGHDALRPYAFAASALAAFVSPLMFGAVADRHVSPVRVLRWLAGGTGGMILLTSWFLAAGVGSIWAWMMILGVALAMAPTFGLTTAVVLSQLRDSGREFGPMRAMATVGWMVGCWLTSAFGADGSLRSGYFCGWAWLGLSVFTWLLPEVPPPAVEAGGGWKAWLGWDALGLLRDRDHRVMYVTASLFSVSLAGLYPYTPPHLQDLGFVRLSAWMSLAQVTEVLALLMLGGVLTRWRLKWTVVMGLVLGALRLGLCAWDRVVPVLVGVALHGVAFACVMITTQVYVAERVDAIWRARAQALLTLMTSGLGSLVGYLACGGWFACSHWIGGEWRWTWFWGGWAVWTLGVLLYFLKAYRGRGHGLCRPSSREREVSACAPMLVASVRPLRFQ